MSLQKAHGEKKDVYRQRTWQLVRNTYLWIGIGKCTLCIALARSIRFGSDWRWLYGEMGVLVVSKRLANQPMLETSEGDLASSEGSGKLLFVTNIHSHLKPRVGIWTVLQRSGFLLVVRSERVPT